MGRPMGDQCLCEKYLRRHGAGRRRGALGSWWAGGGGCGALHAGQPVAAAPPAQTRPTLTKHSGQRGRWRMRCSGAHLKNASEPWALRYSVIS